MNARTADGGSSRFQAAMSAAATAVQQLAPQDELSVWLATESPRLVLEPTRERGSTWILWPPAIPGHHGGATLERSGISRTTRLALRGASGLSKRSATVLVVTDALGAESLKDIAPGGGDLRVGVVGGTTATNAGIVFFDLDPSDSARFLIRIATTDGPPASRSLVLTCDRSKLARTAVAWDAAGNANLSLPLGTAATTGGVCQVRLEPQDDFFEDDSSRLVLRKRKPLAVAVVAATPSPFLVEALRAMPDVVDAGKTVQIAPGVGTLDLEGIDAVVADRAVPPEGVACLTFAAPGAKTVERPLLWGVGEHPILDGVDLSPLRIERAAILDPTPGETTIVATSQGAVGVAGERDGRRYVTFGFHPDASTLPLEAAFPLLVRNALRWLAEPSPLPRYVVAGELVPGIDSWPEAPEREPTQFVPFNLFGKSEGPPLPLSGGDYVVRVGMGGEWLDTVVRWKPWPGFRVAPAEPTSVANAAEAVASLPDRRADADTRVRWAPACAAAGAILLGLGAHFLRTRASAPPRLPPGAAAALVPSAEPAAVS